MPISPFLLISGTKVEGLLKPDPTASPDHKGKVPGIVTFRDTSGNQQTSWSLHPISHNAKPRRVEIFYDRADPTRSIEFGTAMLLIITLPLGVLAGIGHLFWWEGRIKKWARRTNVELVRIDGFIPFWRDPFGTGSMFSKNLVTFCVDVTIGASSEERVWLRFGSFWLPSLEVEEQWESKEIFKTFDKEQEEQLRLQRVEAHRRPDGKDPLRDII